MFREPRRKRQFLTTEATEAILHRGSAGVLAVHGDDGYPYAVPVSYVYADGKIYFHSATTGHKIEGIRNDDKVSFCVIDQDQVSPRELTTHFRSAIVFGRARIVEDEALKRRGLELLGQKYSADFPEETEASIRKEWKGVSIVEIVIEHMTGKQAKELLAKELPAQEQAGPAD